MQNSYTFNIWSNYDKGYDYHWPDGELYHVRQNRRKYITGEGEKFGMQDLSFHYFADLHPNVKGVISGGYLEMMFGGVGGEVVYMPDHKQWALGVDAYWLKQRDFDQKFGFTQELIGSSFKISNPKTKSSCGCGVSFSF